MAKSVSAWQADDGQIFVTEEAAKQRDFTVAFDKWLEERFPPTGAGIRAFDALVLAIKDERMALLKVFKLLNGGNGVPPPRPPISIPD